MENPDLDPIQRTTLALDAELRRRLWVLYDAAKIISGQPNATAEQWSAFHRAVADVPDSQHGR